MVILRDYGIEFSFNAHLVVMGGEETRVRASVFQDDKTGKNPSHTGNYYLSLHRNKTRPSSNRTLRRELIQKASNTKMKFFVTNSAPS